MRTKNQIRKLIKYSGDGDKAINFDIFSQLCEIRSKSSKHIQTPVILSNRDFEKFDLIDETNDGRKIILVKNGQNWNGVRFPILMWFYSFLSVLGLPIPKIDEYDFLMRADRDYWLYISDYEENFPIDNHILNIQNGYDLNPNLKKDKFDLSGLKSFHYLDAVVCFSEKIDYDTLIEIGLFPFMMDDNVFHSNFICLNWLIKTIGKAGIEAGFVYREWERWENHYGKIIMPSHPIYSKSVESMFKKNRLYS